MLERHEIEVVLKTGHSRAEVAKLAGVSVRPTPPYPFFFIFPSVRTGPLR